MMIQSSYDSVTTTSHRMSDTESKLFPAGLNYSCWCLFIPDRHPSDVCHSHQEDQNCHPAAKRSGDRHRKRQGEKGDSWFHLTMICQFLTTEDRHPISTVSLNKQTNKQTNWRLNTETVVFFVAVRVRVLHVQRQHLQVLDVRVSSSGGRTDFPPADTPFYVSHC